MPELISQEERKARKEHTCGYCGEKILKGEKYMYSFLKDGGDIYQWKNHLNCGLIATELWRYIDPHDGMKEEDFQEGCSEFCYTFVCPDCEHYKNKECSQDKPYCLDKIADILKENELMKEKGEYSYQIWKLVPREREGK